MQVEEWERANESSVMILGSFGSYLRGAGVKDFLFPLFIGAAAFEDCSEATDESSGLLGSAIA